MKYMIAENMIHPRDWKKIQRRELFVVPDLWEAGRAISTIRKKITPASSRRLGRYLENDLEPWPAQGLLRRKALNIYNTEIPEQC